MTDKEIAKLIKDLKNEDLNNQKVINESICEGAFINEEVFEILKNKQENK